MERFSRIRLMLGEEKFDRLRNSRVTVIGLGAVGSYATEALARGGVGRLRLVDFDVVSLANVNRQLYAMESTIGLPKVDVAATRIMDINPGAVVESLRLFAAEDTMETIVGDGPDLVIDAIDSLNPKVQVLGDLHRRKIPVLSSMGAALRRNPFAVKIGDLFDVRGCPLARLVRQRLRRQGIERGIACVYSDEPVPREALGVLSEDVYDRGRKRRIMGSLPTLTGIFGLIIAQYAITLLTEEPVC
jgi:tRNA A37 threonylcarbamoyladenosine dehydratase